MATRGVIMKRSLLPCETTTSRSLAPGVRRFAPASLLVVCLLLASLPQSLCAQTNGTVRFRQSYAGQTYAVRGYIEDRGTQHLPVVLDWVDLRSSASVIVAVTGGTAKEGVDFTLSPKVLSASPGDTYSDLLITPMADMVDEGRETIELTLTSPAGGVIIGRPDRLIVYLDDLTGPASVSLEYVIVGTETAVWKQLIAGTETAVWEDDGTLGLRVELTGSPTNKVTVDCRTEPGTALPGVDYQPVAERLQFPEGTGYVVILPVPIHGNRQPGIDKDFRVVLGDPSPGSVLGPVKEVTIRILNDDAGFAFQPQFGTNNYFEVLEDCGLALVDVVILDDTTTRPVTVEYWMEPVSATPEEDYTPVSGTLTFAAGESRKTLAIPIINDNRSEGWQGAFSQSPQSFMLLLANPTGGLQLSRPREVEIFIRDNDPGYSIPGMESFERIYLEERQGSVEVTVSRQGDFNVPSSVHYRVSTTGAQRTGLAAAGVDFLPTEGTLNFAASETNKTFTISLLDDGVIEGSEDFFIALDQATGGVSILTPEIRAIIRDGQKNPVRIDPEFKPQWPVVAQGYAFDTALPVVDPANGKILLATPAFLVNGEDGSLLLRLLPDGQPDPEWHVAAVNGIVHFLQLDADGRVFVSASAEASLEGDSRPDFTINGVSCRHLARLTSDGFLDTAYSVVLPTNSILTGLAVQSNGSVLATIRTNGSWENSVFRLNLTGAQDESFKPAATTGSRTGISPTPDGGLFLTGYNGSSMLRLNPDGSESADFQLPPHMEFWLQVVQPDGLLLVFMHADEDYGDPKLARLLPKGQLDPGFTPLTVSFSCLVLPSAEGRTWVLTTTPWGHPEWFLKRINADGSTDPHWPTAQLIHGPSFLPSYVDELLELPDGDLLLAQSRPDLLNGQARMSMAKLLTHVPLPRFEVDASTARVAENAGRAKINLLRCGTNSEPVTVLWTAQGGTALPGVDYLPASGTLTYPANESIATLELEVLDNAVPDADRTVRLLLQSPSPENRPYPIVEVTIANDDLGFAQDGIRHFPNGRMLLRATGIAPLSGVDLEASVDLRDWAQPDLGGHSATFSFDTAGILDRTAPTNAMRFYRLKKVF